MRQDKPIRLAVACLLLSSSGCAQPHRPPSSDAASRWQSSRDYYALKKIVGTHIDPDRNGHVSKADVLRYLGEAMHSPDDYPNSGPDFWVYRSVSPVPQGSYLYISFDGDGFVHAVEWGSE